MRVGVLGLGRIGALHATTLARLAAEGVIDEVVVSDADSARAEQIAERLNVRVGDAFGTDAVVIATPTATHAALLLESFRRGLPVFCEKPVAVDLQGTLQVLEAAKKAGVLVHIGFQRRFDAGYMAAREAVRSGEIGRLDRVHMLTADPRPPAPGYIPTSGGIYRDCHIHDFDILRWVTGQEVATVYATGANRGESFFAEAGDVDNSAAVLTMTDGTLVTLQGSRYNGHGYDVRMELAGTRKTWAVGLDRRAPLHSAEGFQPTDPPWPDFQTRFEPAYVREMVAFVEALRGERESPCTVEDALAALYIAEAAELSPRENRPVKVTEVIA